MKILVIGAGVLGSYLAHVLFRGGNEVTLLARGNRLAELRGRGLVIRHYAQLTTTSDHIPFTDRFDPEDCYDIVFVVVQRNQLDDLLSAIAANTTSGLFVLVGNNTTAAETLQQIKQNSLTEKQIVFGFQASGGRRENGRVISIHSGFTTTSGRMMLGSLEGDQDWRDTLRQAFEKTKYQLNFTDHMDAWLKYHIAFVMPICFAVYYAGGKLRRIAGDTPYIIKVIASMEEAYRVVEANGYPVEPPEDKGYFEKNRNKLRWMLRIMAATPIGRLVASDHAMAARGEMRRLYDDFCILKENAGVSTPAWDELSVVMKY